MHTRAKGIPESGLKLASIMSLGVDLKGLDKTLVELNVADTSFKKLEDEALDASQRCCLLGRVPRKVVGKDSI